MQQIIYSNDLDGTLRPLLEGRPAVVVTDANVERLALPRVAVLARLPRIVLQPGDDHKDLTQLTRVWDALERLHVTRLTTVVNLGGGMVTDLGGLAAATCKRGLPFINVPTTLLGAVDAAVGGKTGINYNGLKNEIGVFAQARQVVVSTCLLHTLPRQQLLSGMGEVLKHALLGGHDHFMQALATDPDSLATEELLPLVRRSVEVKRAVVEQDPHENGLRRVLNLGHTAGHALESLALQRDRPVPHGYAVAWGLVVEAVLSRMLLHFPGDDLQRLAAWVREHYPAPHITCDDYPTLLDLMRHDKKSRHGEINCTLLAACGDPRPDQETSPDDMQAALDIFRDLMGI